MDKAQARLLREEIQKALDNVGATHGFSFSLGNITFTDTDFSVKLRGIDQNAANGATALQLDWDKNKHKYPLLADVNIGTKFRSDKGDTYEVVGLKPRNRKYPVIAVHLGNGKQYKFSPYAVAVYTGNTL